MSDLFQDEQQTDDTRDDGGLQPLCRCGERMAFVPDDDYSISEDYEWLCPRCDADRIEGDA